MNDEFAFPLSFQRDDGYKVLHAGMELRDYFAAKAMQTMLADTNFTDLDFNPKHICEYAYKTADMMIAQRKK